MLFETVFPMEINLRTSIISHNLIMFFYLIIPDRAHRIITKMNPDEVSCAAWINKSDLPDILNRTNGECFIKSKNSVICK